MKAYAGLATAPTPEVLARAQTGEREAFTELVERHHAELVRIAYAVTGDLDAARDSAQLAWIKAWQRLPTLREPDRLRSWLIAIAANEARQHVRARRRRRVREITPINLEERAGSDTDLSSADRMDLASALVHLGPSDRQLLAMRYLGGLSAEEIGASIGMTASGVRTRLSRVIARLREELIHD
jgi:RNA polymerase sigma-70 factor (ECF subfamily)